MGNETKNGWEKADVILKPVGGLVTALVIAVLGYTFNASLNHRQNLESNIRLYSQLMSQRESSETGLRKDMFNFVLQSFLNPGSSSTEDKVLKLELLSYNFHESLNLKPLFAHLKNHIRTFEFSERERNNYLLRLDKAAREVIRKQLIVLEGVGKKFDRMINLESLCNEKGGIKLEEATLKLDDKERIFRIYVLDYTKDTRELRVRLEIKTPAVDKKNVDTDIFEFWLGPFDFPMVDNTRLSDDQRCAVILNGLDQLSADITLVFFPGCYSSLKDRPYYEDVVQKLSEKCNFL